ncbi:hypothetical protein [Poseidonocella sedimentorum]|uniref:Trypsin-like peptidase domain-containing protein n=1 Tax=Poseidonocella sedimentorum TaxID=871652 RepID=A0A1I6DLH8_9RHOB|nr:hypothetical protein [Poseidonocella sedimentorum]SFR06241.1 hypothetical protein SAMN04515673_10463 [Poseidonocella sedimentorum]
MTRLLVAALATLTAIPSIAWTSSNCGVEGFDPDLCDTLRKEILQAVEGRADGFADILSIDLDTELVTFRVEDTGRVEDTDRQIQLGTNGLSTLDQYLASVAGDFLTAEIWDLDGDANEESFVSTFERSLEEIGPYGFAGVPGIENREFRDFADRLAIRSLQPDALQIVATGKEMSGENNSLRQYSYVLPDGAAKIINILRNSQEVKWQYVKPSGRPMSLEEYVQSVSGNGLDTLQNRPAERGCNAELYHDPRSGCGQTVLALLDSDFKMMGSGVWIGGRYVLTASHIAKTGNWSGSQVFSGHDISDRRYPDDVYMIPLKNDPGKATTARVRHPETGAKTPLTVVRLASPPKYRVGDPPPAQVLANPSQARLRDTNYHGVGFGLTGQPNVPAGVRRKGEMSASCLHADPNPPASCAADPILAEGPFMRLKHQFSPDGTFSWACDLDSGSPVFVLVDDAGEERMALVGILEQSIDDEVTCAEESYFVDVTRDWMQQGIRNAILELEGRDEGEALPAGVFTSISAPPIVRRLSTVIAELPPARLVE